MNVGRNDKTDAATRFFMPPYVVLHDFLDEATVAGLFDHALSRECDFRPTRVGSKAVVDTGIRISANLRDLDVYRPILKSKILGFLPELIAQLQVTPFEPSRLDTEFRRNSRPQRRLLLFRRAEGVQRRRAAPLRDRRRFGAKFHRHRTGAQQPFGVSLVGAA